MNEHNATGPRRERSTAKPQREHGTSRPQAEHGASTPQLPWMAWQVGERVVVRYRLPDGLHDALGHLTEVNAHSVTVETKRGPVTVPAQTMVTGKRVPPAPPTQRQ
ncbi:2-hydroxymuconic semialdehyde dehydrogenase [Gleimia hominis]|uniref:2-hydroxymuconic semialdehyde dehydrogenase n=1 Tax=Gleimia hominis TaxID=595468 RepID=A0ABU3IEC0_9ACTO|nr:2-hydroxymuconic semialdehyde dehydrogenase [Gleimia hominis]MDT3767827.1 2-hydroxymuconic semialdehyde dehydrogenase [Gleimia hominis]